MSTKANEILQIRLNGTRFTKHQLSAHTPSTGELQQIIKQLFTRSVYAHDDFR